MLSAWFAAAAAAAAADDDDDDDDDDFSSTTYLTFPVNLSSYRVVFVSGYLHQDLQYDTSGVMFMLFFFLWGKILLSQFLFIGKNKMQKQ